MAVFLSGQEEGTPKISTDTGLRPLPAVVDCGSSSKVVASKVGQFAHEDL
jgi:hypothetical protein